MTQGRKAWIGSSARRQRSALVPENVRENAPNDDCESHEFSPGRLKACVVDDVPCSIIEAKPNRPLLHGGTFALFETLDGVGAFAIAVHTRAEELGLRYRPHVPCQCSRRSSTHIPSRIDGFLGPKGL